jgi:hypothetical protein
MVCGALLVSILISALSSNQVQESVIKKVEEVITGQTQTNKTDTDTITSLNTPSPTIPNSEDLISNKNSPLLHSQPPTQDTPPPTQSKSFFGGIMDGVKSFGSTIWNSTKNVASSMWNGTKQIASSVWNWTKENKEYVAGGATILAGIGSLFFSPLLGAGILISAGIGGGISWLMDNDPKTIAKDVAIGGFAGIISMGVGGVVTSSIRTGATGLLSKLSPFFQKFLPLSFGGGAAGATDSAIWDKLKNGAVNWKNALLSAAIGIGLVFGAGQLIEKAPSIISQINKLPANPFEQLSPSLAFEGGGSTVSKTIGDTGFGQWLQKFTSKESGRTSNKKNSSAKKDGANVTPPITYLKASKKYFKVQNEYTSSYSASQVLREELYKAGIKSPPYPNAAHHIVPWNMRGEAARKSREILDKYGIDYDSAANGVFLPYKNNNYVGDEILHVGSPSQKYAEYVKNRLVQTENKYKTREAILNELNQIRTGLLNGSVKLN